MRWRQQLRCPWAWSCWQAACSLCSCSDADAGAGSRACSVAGPRVPQALQVSGIWKQAQGRRMVRLTKRLCRDRHGTRYVPNVSRHSPADTVCVLKQTLNVFNFSVYHSPGCRAAWIWRLLVIAPLNLQHGFQQRQPCVCVRAVGQAEQSTAGRQLQQQQRYGRASLSTHTHAQQRPAGRT